MLKYFTGFITIILAVSVFSCDNTNKKNDITDIVVHQQFSTAAYSGEIPKIMANASRGIGFYPIDGIIPPPTVGPRPNNQEFNIDAGVGFNVFLSLTNGRKIERTILVSALVDYNQTKFLLDGEEGLLHEITLPPDSELFLPMSLEIEQPGAHDLLVIYFDDPYNKTLDEDYRMDLFGRTTAFRGVVIVDHVETAVLSDSLLVFGQPVPESITFTHPLFFASTADGIDEHVSHRQLYVANTKPSIPFSFQIVLNNVEKIDSVNYMLVAFLNYHQVPIQNQKTLLAQMEPGTEAIVDMSLIMPNKDQVNLYQMLRLYDPYKSVLNKEVFTPIVFSSPRIAIVTRN